MRRLASALAASLLLAGTAAAQEAQQPPDPFLSDLPALSATVTAKAKGKRVFNTSKPLTLQQQGDRAAGGHDFSGALSLYQQAAADGDTRAMLQVGDLYAGLRNDTGVTPDAEQAMQWYQRAADQGAPDGLARLADLYYLGRARVTEDVARGIGLYRDAAAKGSGDAMTAVGDLATGDRQWDQSARWYDYAAARGNWAGLERLAGLSFAGLGVAADPRQAQAYLQRAFAAAPGPAAETIGDDFLFATHQFPADCNAAVQWLSRGAAAAGGDMKGRLYRLLGQALAPGAMHVDSCGPADAGSARRWLEQAVQAGNAQARDDLARLGG